MSNLRVFISSTFRDLQEEREHLVKKIFPEIRTLCRQRGVTFTDVDLRWGLTDEQAALGTVVRTCLEEVDKCRPYFIGMIGNRYGWVPELHEILMDPDLLARYPFVEELAMEGASVTEMEFVHGVFGADDLKGGSAFFYHRNADLNDADDPERLRALIDRARSSGHPFREFENVETLGAMVREDLLTMIDTHWPERESPSELELEQRAHRAFAASRVRAYIPNPLHLKEFTRWLSEGDSPLVVRGSSGLGKSSLVAYLTEYYRKRHPTAFVVEHYVGASEHGGSAMSVMRHIISEIRERFSIGEPVPPTPEALAASFPDWLFKAEHRAGEEGVSTLIVIDAVNQLDGVGQRMAWLPQIVPAGIKLIVSTTEGESDERLTSRGWDELVIMPIEDERIRRSIIVRYLGEFHKGVSTDQLERVAGDTKANSPLYLRVVAEELRLHSAHETLDDAIDLYTGAEDLLGVFDLVLRRMENDFGRERVGDLLRLIRASRTGLSESELLEMAQMSRLELSRLLFAFDYHLLYRDGLLGFFHDYLRRAVEHRYLDDESATRDAYLKLAEYFEGAMITERSSMELLYALQSLRDIDRQRAALSDMRRFRFYMSGANHAHLLRFWSGSPTERIVDVYRQGLESWVQQTRPTDDVHSNLLASLSDFCSLVGARKEEERLRRERLELLKRIGDQVALARALAQLSALTLATGRVDEAEAMAIEADGLAHALNDPSAIVTAKTYLARVVSARGDSSRTLSALREAEVVAREYGNPYMLLTVIGNLAVGYTQVGEYSSALALYDEAETIARNLGDRRGIGMVTGGRATILFNQGVYPGALAAFREAEAIARELGDRETLRVAVGNRGNTHGALGEYMEALECGREQLDLAIELNDRHAIGLAYGNQGILLRLIGRYDEALESFNQQEAIGTELGEAHLLALARGNSSNAHMELKEYASALEKLRSATDLHRSIGYRHGVTYWLAGTAQGLLELAEVGGDMPEFVPEHVPTATKENWISASLQQARECAEESLAMSRDLSKPDTIYMTRILLARIDGLEGKIGEAIGDLNEMLEVSETDQHRANVHYWIWKISTSHAYDSDTTTALSPDDHRAQALELYRQMIKKETTREYQVRIDELTHP